jgi:hypothetical protein
MLLPKSSFGDHQLTWYGTLASGIITCSPNKDAGPSKTTRVRPFVRTLCSPNEDFERSSKHSGTYFQGTFHMNVAQIDHSRMWKVLWKYVPERLLVLPKSSFGDHKFLVATLARFLYTTWCFLWTSYTHRECMHLVNIIHTSGMHASCEHRTNIRHAWILWTWIRTSYTHQAWTVPYTRHDVFVNIAQTSGMHVSCEHRTLIRHERSRIHYVMFFVKIIHTQ